MSTPENIEIFNRICIVLFDRLYSAFPVPIEIAVNDISAEVAPREDFDGSWDVSTIGREVIEFLNQEGFLTAEGSYDSGSVYLQVRLTMKGLAVLGYVPSTLEKQEALISRISRVARGGLKEAGGEVVRQLVSQVFNLAIAAAPTLVR